jgi:hypothetical protein
MNMVKGFVLLRCDALSLGIWLATFQMFMLMVLKSVKSDGQA